MSRVYVSEPPAAYRARPPLVVDCSALAVVLFGEPGATQENLDIHPIHTEADHKAAPREIPAMSGSHAQQNLMVIDTSFSYG